MKITKRMLRRIIRESLISEQVMWHSTAPENVEAIMSKGLQSGRESANTMAGAWADEFYGKRPIYLSVEKGKYEGTPLAVNAANLDLVADLPTLVDTGAYQEEEGMYWDEGAEPQQMSSLIDDDGMVYFEDLLSPGSAEAQAAIEITGTAAVVDGVPPESIATEEGNLKSSKPSAAESEWASKSQEDKDAHWKNAAWETMAWKRYRKHAQAEGIPFDPDDEEDMKVARAWWKEQPESKQFESKMIITKQQLRRLLREQVLLSESEMLDIVTNPYEDVTDINILANYALRDDMQGALKDKEMQHYIENNEAMYLVDDSYGWLKHVGDEDAYDMPAPEGWDLDKIYAFFKKFEDEAYKVFSQKEKGEHNSLPAKKERELIGNALTMSYVMPDDIKGIEFQVRRSKGKITNINIENSDIVSNLNHEEVTRAGFTMDDIIDVLRGGGAKERKKQRPIKHTPPMYD
jgi:hypothetical protein